MAQSIYFPDSKEDWERVDLEQLGWDADKLSAALDIAQERTISIVYLFQCS